MLNENGFQLELETVEGRIKEKFLMETGKLFGNQIADEGKA